jgi:hypothetical protein
MPPGVHCGQHAWIAFMADRQKRYSSASMTRHSAAPPRRRPPGDARPSTLDWPAWLALIERKRKQLQRRNSNPGAPGLAPIDYHVPVTFSTFKLEGIELIEQEVIDALTHGRAQRKLRSRSAQRIRNHVAILHSIEKSMRLNAPLKTSAVLRWYTSISSGLSTGELGAERMSRLEELAHRINSPQLRLQPAIQEIVRTHRELLADPLFPSFNGILNRLLLRYHLGRCGLPFTVIEEIAFPMTLAQSESNCTYRLLCWIDESYERLLS